MALAATPGTTQVWSGLVIPGADLSPYHAVLSDEERSRAACFRTDQLRDVYVAAHGMLRQVLSEATGQPAQQLSFQENPWGKPALSDLHRDFYFSISHSSDRFLVALSRTGPVGVDIEKIADDAPYDIADQIMTPGEQSLLMRIPAQDRRQTFYDLWARKEAVAKAIGRGLDIDFRTIEVCNGMNCDLAHAVVGDTSAAEANWNIMRLPRIEGFAASLATQHDRSIVVIEKTLG